MADIPLPYVAFFLWIEPVVTLLGAFFAFFLPQTYLELIHSDSATASTSSLFSQLFRTQTLPTGTHVVLRQLGNQYLTFALNEALILRATADLRVWRAFLLVLLIADFGHLYSCLPLGWDIYYAVSKWNAIDWGDIAFVYCGAAMRACFLAGVGMGRGGGGLKKPKAKGRKSIKAPEALAPAPAPAAEDEFVVDLTPAALSKTPAQSTRRKQGSRRSR